MGRDPQPTEIRLRAERLHWIESGDEIVALDEASSMYLSAKGTGTMLWRKLAAGATRAGLIELLVDEFGIDSDTAASDVDRFLVDLTQRGLLEP
jgi:hypothetical protein